jgi:hypothetical protein
MLVSQVNHSPRTGAVEKLLCVVYRLSFAGYDWASDAKSPRCLSDFVRVCISRMVAALDCL